MSSSNRPSRSAWAQCSHACTDGRTDGRDRWQRALCTRARAIQGVWDPDVSGREGGKEPFESPGWGLGSWRVHRPMRRLVAQAARGGAMAWLLKLSVALAQRKAAPRTLFGTDFARVQAWNRACRPSPCCPLRSGRSKIPSPSYSTRALRILPTPLCLLPCLLLQFPRSQTDRPPLFSKPKRDQKCRRRTSPR